MLISAAPAHGPLLTEDKALGCMVRPEARGQVIVFVRLLAHVPMRIRERAIYR
jgi:hypothetical protein